MHIILFVCYILFYIVDTLYNQMFLNWLTLRSAIIFIFFYVVLNLPKIIGIIYFLSKNTHPKY